MARFLVAPTITASPAGGGSVSWEYLTEGAFPNMPDNAYRYYAYTATPFQGYTLIRFDVTVTYVRNGTTITNTVQMQGTRNGNTWTYAAVDNSGGFGYGYMGYAFWYDAQNGAPDDIQVTIISVVAVFDRAPTHLLVYFVDSSSLGSPVRLVHDSATDLLVADY